MTDNIIIFDNTEELAEYIAGDLLKLARKGKALVHIALSGGSTPKAIFSHLSKHYGEKLSKENFHIWWGDDRCVPPEDDDSNYKWAMELWLKPIGFPVQNIHRVLGEAKPVDEVKRYATSIQTILPMEHGLPVFDYIILGLGEDGHTASIFPDQMDLLKSDRICEVATHPESGQKRISLTGKVINNARHIVFLATGEKKAEIVKAIIKDQNPNLPASHVKANNGKLQWLMDKAAASKL